MTTLTEILKRLESREFAVKPLAQDMGYHSVDIPQLHKTESPALFEYATRIAKVQFEQDQALIRTLIEVVRLQDEALLEWIVSGYAEKLEPTYTHTKEARERALTLLREMK